jgi:hypothetical protein
MNPHPFPVSALSSSSKLELPSFALHRATQATPHMTRRTGQVGALWLVLGALVCGSPGVYLQATSVTSNSANLQITALVSNASAAAKSLTVREIVTDAPQRFLRLRITRP